MTEVQQRRRAGGRARTVRPSAAATSSHSSSSGHSVVTAGATPVTVPMFAASAIGEPSFDDGVDFSVVPDADLSQHPWCCVGRVVASPPNSSGFQFVGTGALVASDMVLTASHVLEGRSFGDGWRFQFEPAYKNGRPRTDPTGGSQTVANFTGQVVTGNPSGKPGASGASDNVNGWDYAICELDTPLGDAWGHLGVIWGGQDFYKDHRWTSVGYPTRGAGHALMGEWPIRFPGIDIDDVEGDRFGSKEIQTEDYTLSHWVDNALGDRNAEGWSGGPLLGFINGAWWIGGVMSGQEQGDLLDFDGEMVFAGGRRLGEVHQQAHSAWVTFGWTRLAENMTADFGYTAPKGAPSVCSWGEGRLDVFWRSADNHVRHAWYPSDGGWSWEEDLTAMNSYSTASGTPAAVGFEPGRLDVFWRGPDNHLRHAWYPSDDAWSWEEDLTAMHGYSTMGSEPTVCSWDPGRLDVFWRDEDAHVKHIWYPSDGDWSWEEDLTAMGSYSTASSTPAAVAFEPGRLDLFWRAHDGHLKHIWYPSDDAWSWEEDLTAMGQYSTLHTGASVCSWEPGRLDVFWRDTQDHIKHIWYPSDGNWSWEEDLTELHRPAWPKTTGGSPAAAAWAPGRLDVVWTSKTGGLWHTWYAPDA